MFTSYLVNPLNLLFFSSILLIKCVMLAFFSSTAFGQTALDYRVLSDRIENLEQSLQKAGDVPVSDALQNPSNSLTSVGSDRGNNLGRLQVQLLQLERLVEVLTGQLEEYNFELTAVKKELALFSGDIFERLAVLEKHNGISAAVSPLQNPIPRVTKNASIIDRKQRLSADFPLSSPVQEQLQINNTIPNSELNSSQTFGMLKVDKRGEPLVGIEDEDSDTTLEIGVSEIESEEVIAESFTNSLSAGIISQEVMELSLDAEPETLALPSGTPKEQYDFAFNILRTADYSNAEKVLRLFLESNPDHELAGNAQYWIGETFYVRGDFESAAVEFLTGYETYPNSAKGPDNLLKLALSMASLEKKDEACTSLTRLASIYPSANDIVRRRAQTERSRLKCN